MEVTVRPQEGIIIEIKHGNGNKDDPFRITKQYWICENGQWVLQRELNDPVGVAFPECSCPSP